MTDTKVITHELLDDAGGKLSIDGDQIKVAGTLIAGTLTTRLRTTVVMEYDKTITVAAGESSTALTPINRYMLWDGDSRAAAGQNSPDPTASINVIRVLVTGSEFWMQAAAGNRFMLLRNRALGGDDTAEWLANQSVVLSSGAGFYVNYIGVNDGTIDLATTKANFLTGIDNAIAAEMCVAILTDLPWTTVTGGPTGPGALEHLAYVDWLKAGTPRIGREDKTLTIDTFDVALKPGTVIDYKDGWDLDGLHPNIIGHRNLGTAIGEEIVAANIEWPGDHPAPLPTASGAPIINTNPMMTGTTGTKGSGVSAGAVVATQWRLDQFNTSPAVVTGSKDTDPDGYARQVVTITGTPTAGANPSATLYQSSTLSGISLTGLIPGARVRGVARIHFDTPASASRFYAAGSVGIRIVGTIGGVAHTEQAVCGYQGNQAIAEGFDFPDGIMTPDIVIPEGMTVTSAFFEITIAGKQNEPLDGWVGVSRAALRIIA